ncbi:MAG: hypothetical protein DVB25_05950 [Verrucomicrobia bacterium]|nr:MAG: hypothetical protein DVB25_05950 [Verrucomicrobiota bacterium]
MPPGSTTSSTSAPTITNSIANSSPRRACSKTQDCKTQDTRHKTQDTRHKTQDTRHKTQDKNAHSSPALDVPLHVFAAPSTSHQPLITPPHACSSLASCVLKSCIFFSFSVFQHLSFLFL